MKSTKERLTRVLLVEDDEADYVTTCDMLLEDVSGSTFELDWARSGSAALERLTLEKPPDVCLLAAGVDPLGGFEFLREASERGFKTPIILLAEAGDPSTVAKAQECGAAACLFKDSLRSLDLTRSIQFAMERKRTAETMRFARFLIDGSPDMVFIVNSEAKFVYVNDAACRELGYEREELLSMTVHELDPQVPQILWHSYWERLTMRNTLSMETLQRKKDGTIIPVDLRANYVEFDGEAYSLAYGRNIVRKREVREKTRATEERLRRQNEALTELTKGRVLTNGDLNQALRVITEVAANTLEVERVVIWLLTEDGTKGYGADIYSRSSGTHSEGPDGLVADYPRYFGALERDRVIVAEHVSKDPRFQEIQEMWLEKHGIVSRLDASFHRQGRLAGMICHEQVEKAREWSSDEKAFAGSLADCVLLALEANERRILQSKVEQEQARQKEIVDSLPAAIFFKDREGRVMRANQGAAELFNATVDEIEGRPASELHGNLPAEFLDEDIEIIACGKTKLGTLHNIPTKDGQDRWYEGAKVPYFNAHGEIVGLLTMALDVTTEIKAGEMLKASEARFHAMADFAPVMMWTADTDGECTFANKTWRDFTGRNLQDELGRGWLASVHPDDLKLKERFHRPPKDADPLFRIEYRLRRADGEFRWILESGAPQHDAEGKLSGYVGSCIDITERKMAEKELGGALEISERQRSELQMTLNQLRFGIVMMDAQGIITFISDVCGKLLGGDASVAIGHHWKEVCPLSPADIARLEEAVALPAEKRSKISASCNPNQEQTFWLEIEVHDDPRDPRAKRFCIYDVTEIHDLRSMLREEPNFRTLIGESAAMRSVCEQIREVAKLNSTVLIEGETGSGKELVARAIHDSSPRRSKPFIAVNCAGLNESLLQSQLFGHRRGSFTGALRDQLGLFEAAHGGTLFLDEIGDIPPEVQTNLLRVLQEREVIRIGDTNPRKIDVRVLAATQFDLSRLVAEGDFRADLLFRIRVARIELPPLRDRDGDIELLISSYLARRRSDTGKIVDSVSTEAMEKLRLHAWPGNVRELEGVMEYAAIRCRGSVIGAQDLPLEILQPAHASVLPVHPQSDERLSILAALRATGGNKKAAAHLMGMSRATLYRKLAGLEFRQPLDGRLQSRNVS